MLLLEFYVVPTPNVSVIVHNIITVGHPVTLECIVTIMRGINNQIYIVWSSSSSSSGKELRRSNVSASMAMFKFVVYRDYFNISLLTTDDNNIIYECKVMINAIEANDSFILQVRGKQLNCINEYILFSCHINLFCIHCFKNIIF